MNGVLKWNFWNVICLTGIEEDLKYQELKSKIKETSDNYLELKSDTDSLNSQLQSEIEKSNQEFLELKSDISESKSEIEGIFM